MRGEYVRGFFLLVALALVYAALCGAPLAWDGSYYLFQVLDNQEAFVPAHRYVNHVMQLPVRVAQKLTEDVDVLIVIFGLGYAAIPLISLLLCWIAVKDHDRSLFLWPALGICVGTLSMQLFFVGEVLIAVSLFWPVLMALLVRVGSSAERTADPPNGLPTAILVVLSLLVLVTHPGAGPLFAAGSAVALAAARLLPGRGPRLHAWFAALAALAAASFIKSSVTLSAYEGRQLAVEAIRKELANLQGPLLHATLIIWLTGAVLLAASLRPAPAAALQAVALVLLAACGSLFVYWAHDMRFWFDMVNVRKLTAGGALPFMSLAAVDAVLVRSKRRRTAGSLWPGRHRAILASGLVFTAVVATQAFVWSGFTRELVRLMDDSARPYLVREEVDLLKEAPVFWSAPALSMILQGREPERVLVDGRHVIDLRSPEGLRIAPWKVRPWDGGWFELGSIRRSAAEVPEGFWAFREGWHAIERSGGSWWCWSSGRGSIRIQAAAASETVIAGALGSLVVPNRIDVSLNGEAIARVDVEARRDGSTRWGPLPVSLRRGPNRLVFVSANGGMPTATDTRELAIVLRSLTIGDPSRPAQRLELLSY